MKVAINALPLKHKHVSGTSKYLSMIIKYMVPLLEKHEKLVLLYPGNIYSDRSPNIEAVMDVIKIQDCIELINLPYSTLSAFHYRILPKYLQKRPDINVFHEVATISNLSAIAQGSVVTVHDISCIINPQWCSHRTRAKYRRYFKQTLAGAKVIITPSKFTKKEIIDMFEEGLGHNIRVIPHGVEEKFFTYRGNISGPILHVGAFTPRKGYDVFLKFLEHLLNGNMNCTVRMAGNLGEYGKRRIMQMVDRTRVRGYYDGYIEWFPDFSDPEEVYNAASVLVSFSLYEGFGLPILEAMASSIPVVCHSLKPYREILPQNYKFLVDIGDIDQAKEYLLDIITNPKLYGNIAHKLRSRAMDFPWSKTASTTLEIYRSVYEVG